MPNIGSVWTDRRPIGRIILAQTANESSSNLNGWMNGGPVTLGNADFQLDIRNRISDSIANVQSVSGQGIIIWDITGGGSNNSVLGSQAYLGDPRFLNPAASGLTTSNGFSPFVPPGSSLGMHGVELAMEAIADSLFSSILASGLQCGVALRGTKVGVDVTGVLTPQPAGENQAPYDTVLHQLADLDAKLIYAKNRWGCRLFYVDSNDCSSDVKSSLQSQGNATWAPAYVYTQLNARHPDCVIFPEEHFDGAFAYAGPPVISDSAYQYLRVASRYTELANQWQGPFLQPDELSAVPDAFALISCANAPNPDPADTFNVVDALQHQRAILMADAWYSSPSLSLAADFMRQAAVDRNARVII